MAEYDRDLEGFLESSSFDCDALRVFRIRGREAVSELFEFEIDVARTSDRELPEELRPGAPATVGWTRHGVVARRIHGMVESVRTVVEPGAQRAYHRLRLVPRAHRLTLVSIHSIFLDKSVPDLWRAKLGLVGLGGALQTSLLAAYPALEFAVQLGETDLAFLARRAEHVGISYFFVHDEQAERLVLTDHNEGFPELEALPSIDLEAHANAPERLSALERVRAMVPSVYLVHDYNYRRPDLVLQGQADVGGAGGGIAEYGVHVKTTEEGAALARVRAEEIACRSVRYTGSSTISGLSAGHRTTLAEQPDAGLAEDRLLLTAVEHELVAPLAQTGDRSHYRNRFEAVSVERTYRPRRTTPVPRVPSVLTGVVQIGPDEAPGGVARIDEEGRYLVQFHFDSWQEASDRPSRRMRMLQPYGGTGHGMHFPLRPGVEVVIGFANGDPDRPLILGAVPNAHTRSPVTTESARRNRITTKTGVMIEIGEHD